MTSPFSAIRVGRGQQQHRRDPSRSHQRLHATRFGKAMCLLTVGIFAVTLHQLILGFRHVQGQPHHPLELQRMPRHQTHEAKPSLPTRDDNDSTFSACLLVMDDNHFLIEWLAYHYMILPLRYLIVAIDPRSRTSPHPVLERWKDRITVVTWNDTDFMPDEWNNRPVHENDGKDKFIRHRERQRHFYPACMEALRDAGRSWTSIIDSDEYLHINTNYQRVSELPPTFARRSMTVLDVIQQDPYGLYRSDASHAAEPRDINSEINTKCIMMPRLRFGNHETNGTDALSQCNDVDLPLPLHPKQFQTLRWNYRADLHNRKQNRNPKSIINVRSIANFSRQDTDAHRPVRSECPQRGLYVQNKDSPFVVHHYVGTWQQYSFRKDARDGMKQRNPQRFAEYGTIRDGVDGTICGWVSDFVDAYGVDQFGRLLAGVGDVGCCDVEAMA